MIKDKLLDHLMGFFEKMGYGEEKAEGCEVEKPEMDVSEEKPEIEIMSMKAEPKEEMPKEGDDFASKFAIEKEKSRKKPSWLEG